uniref:Odorant receptor 46 n=1 Tax=Holotrichia parallela TaxID=93412 RepID=A0A2P9JY83_HOLPA|nr:odorant receptor 46 [Holotrichia parallela]
MDALPGGQQTSVRLLYLLICGNKLKRLYEMVNETWPNDVLGSVLKKRFEFDSQRFKKFFIAYVTVVTTIAMIYMMAPTFCSYRRLVTEWYLPCDLEFDVCYISARIAELVYMLLIFYQVLVFDGMFCAFLFCLFMEVEKIKHSFKHLNIGELNSRNEVNRKFCSILKHHGFVLEFLKRFNAVYSVQMLNHFLTLAAALCFGMFLFSKDGFPPSSYQSARYGPYVIAYNIQLYTCCYAGELIYNQLLSISDAIYESMWYLNNESNVSNGVRLAIQVSQIGNKITIGGLWPLNLRTYMSVFKTSVSLNALLQTVYINNEKSIE